MKIKEYLDKMKNYKDKKNISRICDKHSEEYIFYCIDCKSQLCNECAKNKMQKKHKKIYLFDELPEDDDIKIIQNIIEEYNNKIIKLKKEKDNKLNEIRNILKNEKKKKIED